MFLSKRSFQIFLIFIFSFGFSSIYGMHFVNRFFGALFYSQPSNFQFLENDILDQQSLLEVKNEEYMDDDEVMRQYFEFLKKKEKKFPEKIISVGENKVRVRFCDFNGKELCQPYVLDQVGNENSGGGSSCGYQSIKNGIVTVLADCGVDVSGSVKRFMDSDAFKEMREKNFETKLKDQGFVKQFFKDMSGIWRRNVVRGRIKSRLEKIVKSTWKNFVHVSEQDDDDTFKKEKISLFFSQVVDQLATGAISSVFDQEKIADPILLSKQIISKKSYDDIKDYYKTIPDLNEKEIREDFEKQLCNRQMFQRYIDIDGIENLKATESNLIEWLEKYKESNAKTVGLRESDLNGDWLDANEIENIMEYEQKQGMLRGVKKFSWIVYDDLNLIGGEFDPNREKLFDVCRTTILDPKHRVLFFIGTMTNNSDANDNIGGTQGHWFPLVCTKKRNIVMDSLANKNRLDDEGVFKVIDTFEKQKERCKIGMRLTEYIKPRNVNAPAICFSKFFKKNEDSI